MNKKSQKKENKSSQNTKLLKNKLFIFILSLCGITNLATLAWGVTHIKNTDMPVPIRYTSITNFDQLGKWYQMYFPLLISLIILSINLFLAFHLYKKSKVASLFLLLVSLMVSVLALAITFGFTSINYGI